MLFFQGPLVRWLKVNFGEAFIAWIHVKALRVFVESVLRYMAGVVLPTNHYWANGSFLWAFRYTGIVLQKLFIKMARLLINLHTGIFILNLM